MSGISVRQQQDSVYAVIERCNQRLKNPPQYLFVMFAIHKAAHKNILPKRPLDLDCLNPGSESVTA
ncbi:MAG: hypothetical protein ACKVP5_01765 [Aestuariivirga sp.]